MNPSIPNSVDELYAEKRQVQRILYTGLILAALIVFGVIGLMLNLFPKVNGGLIGIVGITTLAVLIFPVIVWNNPRTGIYILFALAALFGFTPGMSTITIPTSYVPIWANISTIGRWYGTTSLTSISFSPPEVIIVITLLAFLVRTISARELKLHAGPFAGWILFYELIVLLGYVRGVTSGGETTMALYEVRAQATFLLAYFMGVNMFTHREQLKPILWALVLGSGFIGICGTITFISKGGVTGPEGFMSHDDSLFFNRIFFIVFLFALANQYPRLKKWALAFTPTALIAMLANQRRAGIAAFIIAFIPLVPLMWYLFKERRKQIFRFALGFAIISAIYFPIAWNGTGAWALPARALRSSSDPNGRDASSDYYRLAETNNLLFTRDYVANPWIGLGYGKPFAMIYALPAVTTDFLQYMPHNSVLWVWMRLGHLGFFAFIMMIAAIMIRGPQIMLTVKDPFLRLFGLMAMLDMLMIFTYGKYDLQLTNPRQMVCTAFLIGILGSLNRIDGADTPMNEAGEVREESPALIS